MSHQRLIGYALALCAAGFLFAGYGHYVKYGHFALNKLAEDFYSDYFAELLGIVFTVLFLDQLIRQREQRQEEQREKEELVMRLGDGDHWAAKLLRQRGWLQDGTLRGARLDNAYLARMALQGADLREADLRNATLHYADLRDANLRGANLQGARLSVTKYNKATLWPEDVDPVARGAILVETENIPWI